MKGRRRASGVVGTRRFPGSLIGAALIVSGCAVGPNFKQPAPPAVQTYLPEPLPPQEMCSVSSPA
jgi:hypothetical protein